MCLKSAKYKPPLLAFRFFALALLFPPACLRARLDVSCSATLVTLCDVSTAKAPGNRKCPQLKLANDLSRLVPPISCLRLSFCGSFVVSYVVKYDLILVKHGQEQSEVSCGSGELICELWRKLTVTIIGWWKRANLKECLFEKLSFAIQDPLRHKRLWDTELQHTEKRKNMIIKKQNKKTKRTKKNARQRLGIVNTSLVTAVEYFALYSRFCQFL